MATPRDRVRKTVRHPVGHALLALLFIGVGVSMIVTSIHDRTETVTARVSAQPPYAYPHADNVDFKFADGSTDSEVVSSEHDFFDAVTQFGPGSARVTRNAQSHTIYKVEFHGKTYTLLTHGEDLGGGIIAVVLGLLGLAYVVLTSRSRSRPAAALRK